MKQLNKKLKKTFEIITKYKSIILIFFILIFSSLVFTSIRAIMFSMLFILLGSISKLYHRFFKSTLGIDLILFFTLLIHQNYHNFLLAFIVGWVSLIIADTLSLRFSYTSIISLIGLTAIIFISKFITLPIIFTLILLTIIYEIITVLLYYLMGSSLDKILMYLISHLIFNMFLIFSFAEKLSRIMI